MPKSKRRKTRGGQGKKSGVSGNTIAAVIAAVIIAGGGYSWWSSGRTEVAFMEDVASGKSILSKVKTIPAAGTTHLRPGENYNYPDIFPTSGPHASRGTPAGFYDSPQRATGLVHALDTGTSFLLRQARREGARSPELVDRSVPGGLGRGDRVEDGRNRGLRGAHGVDQAPQSRAVRPGRRRRVYRSVSRPGA